MIPWKQQSTEIVFDSKFFRVRKDMVELPTKKIIEWYYWDSRDSVMVLGMTDQQKLVMIKQYRYLAHDEMIEFPAGGLHDGESPEAGAKREFEEETGYSCDTLISLGSFYETYGQLNRKIHLFFAPQVKETRQQLDNQEGEYEEIEVCFFDLEEVVKMAHKNVIVAMGCALAILLLREKMKNGEISNNTTPSSIPLN